MYLHLKTGQKRTLQGPEIANHQKTLDSISFNELGRHFNLSQSKI